jgi:hypothetical protein
MDLSTLQWCIHRQQCKYSNKRNCFIFTGMSFAPRKYTYFDAAVGRAWSYDPESYAGGSVATSRVSHAGKTKRDTLVLQVGGLAWG